MATRKRSTLGTKTIQIQQTPRSSMRMSMGPSAGFGTMSIHRNVAQSYNAPPGHLAQKSKVAVNQVLAEKDKDKKNMGELNTKLAHYIQQRQYNESIIKVLQEQIDNLTNAKCPDIEGLRDEFTMELESFREALDKATKENADLQGQLIGFDDKIEDKNGEIDMLRKQIKDLENKLKSVTSNIGDLECECSNLRKQLENMNGSNERLAEDKRRLEDDLERAREDTRAARTEQMNASNELAALEAHKEFDDDTNQKLIDELTVEINTLKRSKPDFEKHFTHGFEDAVSELHKQYEETMANRIAQITSNYESKILAMQAAKRPDTTDSAIVKNEVKSLKSKMSNTTDENARLRREIDDWKHKYDNLCQQADLDRDEMQQELARLEARLRELEGELCENEKEMELLEDSKMSLEAEISLYRKLLEGEGNLSLKSVVERSGNVQTQGGSMMADMILQGSGGGSASQNSNPDVSKPQKKEPGSGQKKQPKTAISQSSGSVHLQKKCKGPLHIGEVASTGQYIEVGNSGTAVIDISGYSITRQTERKGLIEYTFPANTSIGANKQIRVYGYAFEDEGEAAERQGIKGTSFLVADKKVVNVWPVGNGVFKLNDNKGNEKASAQLTFSR